MLNLSLFRPILTSNFKLIASLNKTTDCLILTNSAQLKLARYVQLSASPLLASVKRPPVVTIMGHVDHGKTTLLDYLRNSRIVEKEFGGITQHIGAFVVPFKQKDKTELVTFLDTPGHAAFASMRQRGANVTDIVVLMIACEDGILDQTVESIRYAKASGVPIIVAVNKIDKYTNKKELKKNIDLVKQQLVVHDVVTESDGGDVQLIPISALKGIGIEDLKEAILALAETLELRSDIDCLIRGRVIESLVDPHRGKLCTILVQNGQLNKGDVLLAGNYNWAKVRALFDERGQLKQCCGPGLPIQVTGWREEILPSAGDPIEGVENETEAKSIVAKFKQQHAEKKAFEDAKMAAKLNEGQQQHYRAMLDKKREAGISMKYRRTLKDDTKSGGKLVDDGDKLRKINMILKCDVDGSLEALMELLDTYDKHNKQPVKLDVMHFKVGPINENDIILASSFPNSIIYGFNVKLANQGLMLKAKENGVSLKLFNVIYHLIDDLKARLSELMPELEQENEVGRANVIQEFVISEKEGGKKKISRIAGCRCSRGVLKRDLYYKLLRNNKVLIEGLKVKSLKHLKDDAKEIEKDRECGISFHEPEEGDIFEEEEPPEGGGKAEKGVNVAAKANTVSELLIQKRQLEFRPGDVLVAYEKQKFKPKLKWELKGFA